MRAECNIEENKITCKRCKLEIDYDDYIEQMKEKAATLADDFQSSWNRRGF